MMIQIKIFTEVGEFLGMPTSVNIDQFEEMKKISVDYYKNGFEMVSDFGGYIIIPPKIIERSVLKIDILDDSKE